jgi:hypothetical protein
VVDLAGCGLDGLDERFGVRSGCGDVGLRFSEADDVQCPLLRVAAGGVTVAEGTDKKELFQENLRDEESPNYVVFRALTVDVGYPA